MMKTPNELDAMPFDVTLTQDARLAAAKRLTNDLMHFVVDGVDVTLVFKPGAPCLCSRLTALLKSQTASGAQ